MGIEEFAKKYIQAEKEAWQTGNFDLLEAIEVPDIIFHRATGQSQGGHIQLIQENRLATTDLVQEWEYLVGDGNLFVLSYKSSSTEVVNTAFFVCRVENEKVVEMWIHSHAQRK